MPVLINLVKLWSEAANFLYKPVHRLNCQELHIFVQQNVQESDHMVADYAVLRRCFLNQLL